MLVSYKSAKIKLAPWLTECLLDEDFIPKMEVIVSTAEKYGVTLLITNAFRKTTDKLSGAIVTPAKMSCHLVGHGVDVNYEIGEQKYNSERLKTDFPLPLTNMIEELKTHGIRWGGDFKKKDEIHFDDGLNILHPEIYKSKYELYQQ